MNTQTELFDPDSFTKENNKETIEGLPVLPKNFDDIFSMSVNWTYEGICQQIMNGDIELSPSFQRRNAWDDQRKSDLIESLYLGLPVPPIILVEYKGVSQDEKKRFIVIDGKQRLLSMIGFFAPEQYPYWKENHGKIKSLRILKEFNGKTYQDLDRNKKRILNNAIVPTWILHNISTDTEVLYEIFYRVNAGAMSLNFQELRHALYRGKFSDYLAEVTQTLQPFQEVMGYTEPNERLDDAEYLLRIFANKFMPEERKGGLAKFLDKSMLRFNKEWSFWEKPIKEYYQQINQAIVHLEKVFGNYKNIATINPKRRNFNKAFFEAELYYFAQIDEKSLEAQNIEGFKNDLYRKLEERQFSDLFTRGTNSNDTKRFEEFGKIVQKHFKIIH